MELVLESVLKVVFQQVHYRDRNVALIKQEGGIMLHLGRFTKAKHTGHEKKKQKALSNLFNRSMEWLFSCQITLFAIKSKLTYRTSTNFSLFLPAGRQPTLQAVQTVCTRIQKGA